MYETNTEVDVQWNLYYMTLQIKDTIEITFEGPKMDFSIIFSANTFSPLKSGLPLYSGQIRWSQCVLYREVPLHTYYVFSMHYGGVL